MFEKLEKIIGYSFKNKSLLKQAITHVSYANINGGNNYERLEFLGDSVLEMVVSEMLFSAYPLEDEGSLTKRREYVVEGKSLEKICVQMGLDAFLLIAKQEGAKKVKSDLYESILGAIYLDSDYDTAKAFIERTLTGIVHDSDKCFVQDYKTKVKEYFEKVGKVVQFKEIAREGKEHKPIFTMALVVNDEILAVAKGNNKKDATQNCAKIVLEKLGI